MSTTGGHSPRAVLISTKGIFPVYLWVNLYILEIRMRSRVPRAANVYLLRTRSRVTFAASLQHVCTGRELG